MVDNKVRYDNHVCRKRRYIVPATETLVHLGVVHWVEPSIGTIKVRIKREDMNAAKHAPEAVAHQLTETVQSATKAVRVYDQLGPMEA